MQTTSKDGGGVSQPKTMESTQQSQSFRHSLLFSFVSFVREQKSVEGREREREV